MEYVAYIIIGLVLLNLLYTKVIARQSFNIIDRIVEVTGYKRVVVHQFIMNDLLEAIGKEYWKNFEKIVKNEKLTDKVLVPAFFGWCATRYPANTSSAEASQRLATKKMEEANVTIDEVNAVATPLALLVSRAKMGLVDNIDNAEHDEPEDRDEIDDKLVEAIASLGKREEEKGRKEADFIFEHFLSNGKTITLSKMEKHIEENYSYNTMAVQAGFKERMTYYSNNGQVLVFLQDDGDIVFKHADFV